jgi:glycine betaine/proline transport system ATP-binding protein
MTTTVSSNEPAISVRNLWKIFGPTPNAIVGTPFAELSRPELLKQTGCVAAVNDVSFDVADGEVFVVMGLSGSGKSTLVRCLTRLIEPTSGQVMIEGEDILAASKSRLRELRRTKFSMVFQHFGLLPHRSIVDNIAYSLEVNGIKKDKRHARAHEVIELVGLSGYANHYPEQLSGGMQQRVGLARALAVNPEVMFLDEPFSALDPLIRRDMQNEIVRLHKDLGTTMVFITHDLAEAMRIGDRIAIMRDGAMVQVGTPTELVLNPVDDYVSDFTNDIPKSHVLCVADIAKPLGQRQASNSQPIEHDVIVRSVMHRIMSDPDPINVVENGQVIGSVGREELITVFAADVTEEISA